MDDLAQKLNDLLSSPDSMEKIQSAMAAMGLYGDGGGDDGGASPDEGMADTIQSLLAGLSGGGKEKPAHADSGGLPDLSAIAKMAPLMAGLNKEDENTALLKALRPYLHGDREKRLDDAIQMMKMMKLLPLLQGKVSDE